MNPNINNQSLKVLDPSEATTSRFESSLTILNEICANYITGSRVSDEFYIVGAQHLTSTTLELIYAFIATGFIPSNIFLHGKSYSTNPKVLNTLKEMGVKAFCLKNNFQTGEFKKTIINSIKSMWEDVEKCILEHSEREKVKLIILDDGGRCISLIPPHLKEICDIVAIEQTTKGIRNINVINADFPVVNVAGSAFKKHIESPIISKAIITSIIKNLNLRLEDLKVGIIGMGNIGSALEKEISSICKMTLVLDIDKNKEYNFDKLETLVAESDIVFGCTGKNIEIDKSLFFNTKTILASCSSEDVEFNNVIKSFQFQNKKNQENFSSDLVFRKNETEIIILKSGFPVNFSNLEELEPARMIQVTRCLLYCAVIQAVNLINIKSIHRGLTPLDELYQKDIFTKFLSGENSNLVKLTEYVERFSSSDWILENSIS